MQTPGFGRQRVGGNVISRYHVSVWNQFQTVRLLQPSLSFTYGFQITLMSTNSEGGTIEEVTLTLQHA